MLSSKRFRTGLMVLALAAVAGIAYAYFSTSGSGTGNVQAGTSSNLTITGTITPGTGGLVPGGNPASVAFSVNNPGSGAQRVAAVSLSGVQAYSDSGHTTNITGTTAGKCDTTQFSMTAVTENQTVAAGNTSLTNNGSLVFNDPGTNQDGCKNAYLVASFTSN